MMFPPWCPVCLKDSPPTNKACDECHAKRVAWLNREKSVGTAPIEDLRLFVVLHVGFLSVEETEDHLNRLDNYEPVTTPTPARSRITKSKLAKITPIDRTAARVGPAAV